ncbi:DUF4365 domain-containing protein [Bosea sp. BK604]|uniref:DUF4365 domain-containing protein n=1 Tax=Bosea sp. BK604 TaxID=2512180 RepID=UPI0010436AAD|nr:DUF4365 domain-containing protein [Bosea sp. BK604]
MITKGHSQETFSRAHLYAVAARAGVTVSRPELDYGVDAILRPVVMVGKKMSESAFGIDVQLKSTTTWSRTAGHIKYDLDAAAYNRMIAREPGEIPLYVFLLCLPPDPDSWLDHSETETILRNCCYWYRANGPRTFNERTIAIDIPRSNLLTSDALISLIAAARSELMT